MRVVFVLVVGLGALILVAGLHQHGNPRGGEAATVSPAPPNNIRRSGGAQPEVRRAIAVPSVVKSSSPPVASSASSISSETPYVVVGVADGDALNVRSGPGVNNKVIARLANGYGSIQIVGAPVLNDTTSWVQITFEGHTGWVTRSHLKPE